jgi:hypothetical protein
MEFENIFEFEEYCAFWGCLPRQKTINNGTIFSQKNMEVLGTWEKKGDKYYIYRL